MSVTQILTPFALAGTAAAIALAPTAAATSATCESDGPAAVCTRDGHSAIFATPGGSSPQQFMVSPGAVAPFGSVPAPPLMAID